MRQPQWSKAGEFVTIKRHAYKVIESTATNNLLRPVVLARGRKLYTATQCLTGAFTTPVKVEGYAI